METSIPDLASKVPTETAAYRFMERLRWHGHPVCPHCGVIDGHYYLKPKNGTRRTSTGKATARRIWRCHACRKKFSVLTGTPMHGSHIPVRTWLFVLFEMVASKNGVAAREIQRKYGLTSRAAWHMMHRIRSAMSNGPLADLLQGTIIADETYYGGKPRYKQGTLRARLGEKHYPPKAVVLTLINRERGEARSKVIPNVTADTLFSAITRQVHFDQSRLMTDEHKGYWMVGNRFPLGHDRVFHGGGEYVRGDVTTNDVELFFSQLKRSIDGTFHAVSHEHLERYCHEFDYRFSTRTMTDSQRMEHLAHRLAGKRLTYRPCGSSSDSASVSSLVA